MKYKIISVDFQKDFSAKGGVCYEPRRCIKFIKESLVAFCRKKKIKIAEIVSDYRQPRPGDRGDCCHPGEWGYESEIPKDIKEKSVWVKCMNSPLWVRRNGGVEGKSPGLPYEDPKGFNKWLNKNVGKPKDTSIILVGLTLDCCVLCTAQALDFRGYKVFVLKEGVDTYAGTLKEKTAILKLPLANWAEVIDWNSLKKML